MAAPAIPVHSTPAAAATGISISPEYAWEASAGTDSYNIEVSDVSDFSNLLASASVTGLKFFFYPALPAATRIYWRVSATNVDGTSAWGTGYFDTEDPDFGFHSIKDHVARGKKLVLHQFQENFG